MAYESPIVPLDWLVEDDFAILQWLGERDIVTTPKVLAYELDIGYSQIRKRLHELENRNLIRHPSQTEVPNGVSATGVYLITELGKRIASGELTINEMRELAQDGAFNRDVSESDK